MENLQFRDYLSEKQINALEVLVCLGSTLEAAEKAGIDEKDVIQWIKTDPWFKAALNQEKNE